MKTRNIMLGPLGMQFFAWTQLELSHKTKLSLSTLADIEQGRRGNINLKTPVLLSKALKTHPTKLLK